MIAHRLRKMLDLAVERAEVTILADQPAADRWLSVTRSITDALPRVEVDGEPEDIEIIRLVLSFRELEEHWLSDATAPRERRVTYPAGPF